VFVLVSTQMQMLRLLDGSEDNLLRCRKQEAPPPRVRDASWELLLQNSSVRRRLQPFR
jgi:hypothetical protein